jgi:hypothetical protein
MNKRKYIETIYFQHQGKETIKQIDSQIEYITVNVDYSNNLEFKHDPHSYKINPNDSPPFVSGCLNWRCSKEYFDITNHVLELARSNKMSLEIEFICDGTTKDTSPERCGVHAKFELVKKLK